MFPRFAARLSLVVGMVSWSVSAPHRVPPRPVRDIRPVSSHRALGPLLGPVSIADSLATHTHAVLAISEFFLEWQRLWRASAAVRLTLPGGAPGKDVRLPYLHCHPGSKLGARMAPGTGGTDDYARKFAQYPLIPSAYSTFAACPSWVLTPTIPDALDEQDERDGALVSALRASARSARAQLLTTLDSVAGQLPGSGFVTGQRVRFRIEQGDLDGAARAARECRAQRWWCLALSAFVLDRRGASFDAEVGYRAMQAAMPESMSATERCAWNDVHDLLAPAENAAYDKLSCETRANALATFWWLADPLFRLRGNERWVTHQSRRVDIALRAALDGDERYAWDSERGGDALTRLIVRYGWPSYGWWDGRATDEGHSLYLRQNSSIPVPPYSTFEYSKDRVHLVPAWRVVSAPLAARANDWDVAQLAPDGEIAAGWWSPEHVRTPRRLVQLAEGQTAFFRRQSNVVIATAHRLRQPLLQRGAPQFDVLMLASTSASSIDTLAHGSAGGGATIALRSSLRATPAVLAIEAMGIGASRVDARTRFSVHPPAPLSAMQPGEVAISDAALLDASSEVGDQRVPDETLLDHLLGSLSLSRSSRRLGVYWETYGIAPRDTVTIAVSMQRDAAVGGLRRLGAALKLTSDPTRSVSMRWTEPNPQYYTRTIDGPVPVQLRRIMLNLAQLTPGPYVLRVSVERPGGVVASSERRVVLEP